MLIILHVFVLLLLLLLFSGRGVAVAGRLERGSLERGEKCVLMGFDKMINTHIVGKV